MKLTIIGDQIWFVVSLFNHSEAEGINTSQTKTNATESPVPD